MVGSGIVASKIKSWADSLAFTNYMVSLFNSTPATLWIAMNPGLRMKTLLHHGLTSSFTYVLGWYPHTIPVKYKLAKSFNNHPLWTSTSIVSDVGANFGRKQTRRCGLGGHLPFEIVATRFATWLAQIFYMLPNASQARLFRALTSGSNVQKFSFFFILLICLLVSFTGHSNAHAQDAGPTYRRVRLRTWFSKRKRLSDCLHHLCVVSDILHSCSSQQQLIPKQMTDLKEREKVAVFMHFLLRRRLFV